MARPIKCRRICALPKNGGFKPQCGCKKEEIVLMSLDEYEAVRLLDLEMLTQEECAAHMGVARTTVTDIYTRARNKLANALVNGKQLIIEGGNYQVCQHREGEFKGKGCVNCPRKQEQS
ncbi:MAG: DUF134 domain-containing protein [Oscillospiraceae bacterium]